MLSENIIKLFDELGYIISIDANGNYLIIDKTNNNLMNVTIKNGTVIAENENISILFGYTCPISDIKRVKDGYTCVLGNLTLENRENNSIMKFGCYGSGLLVSDYNVSKEGLYTKVNSYSILINNNGTLTINLNDPVAYVSWNRQELLTNVEETKILDILSDEKLLAIVNYYSLIYPEMLEGVVELTQYIVSKSLEEPLTRKLIKN